MPQPRSRCPEKEKTQGRQRRSMGEEKKTEEERQESMREEHERRVCEKERS